MKKSIDHYFQKARTWAEDVYVEAIASRNRYRFAFLWSLVIISLSLTGFVFLLPLQHTQLIIIHHEDDGTIWVEQMQQKKLPVDRSQIESDIVRYVVNRESYSAFDYDHHYELVNLLSNAEVAKEYRRTQNAENPDSFIDKFSHRIIRSAHVQNIIFLNKDLKHPLVQVNFTVTDRDRMTGLLKKHASLALLSWEYRGTPKDSHSKWLNWDGFTVTHYSVQQRMLEKE